MDPMKFGESLWKLHMEHMRVLEYIVSRSGTRGENGVLLYLYHNAHPMFAGELTEKLGLTSGRVANILRTLEKSDMITRAQYGRDKRRVLVALTPGGEAEAARQNREAVALQARLMSRMTPEESEQFIMLVERMVEVIDEDVRGEARAERDAEE